MFSLCTVRRAEPNFTNCCICH